MTMSTTPNLDKKKKNNRRRPTTLESKNNKKASWSFDPNHTNEVRDISKLPKKVAVYKRISELVDESVTFQRQHEETMEALLLAYGLSPELGNADFVYFEEEGSAYKNHQRPKFNNMVDRCEAGEFTHVAAYEFKRILRRKDVADKIKPIFRRMGIKLCIKKDARDGIDLTTGMGDMYWDMLARYAQDESDSTVDRTIGGHKVRAKYGIKRGGYDPFGLRTVKKQVEGLGGMRSVFEIDDEPQPDYPDNWSKAQITREIYRRFSDGQSISSIVKWMNRAEFPCAQGGDLWTQGHIRRILSAPVYMGGSSHKDVILMDGDSYKITHEQLISIEDWDKVQVLLEARKIKKQERPKASQLSGLLRCGNCEHTLLSCSAKTHGKALRLFRCNTPSLGGNCAGNQVAAVGLEETIYDLAYAIISNKDLYEAVTDKSRNAVIDVQTSDELDKLEELAFLEADLQTVRSPRAKADLEGSILSLKAEIGQIRAKQSGMLELAKHTNIAAPDLFKQAWDNEDRVQAQIYVQSLFKDVIIRKSAVKHNHHYYKNLGWKMDIDRVTVVLHDGTQVSLRDIWDNGAQVIVKAAA